MPSISRSAFDDNAGDVERLLELHTDIGGDKKGRRYGLEVLNKSAILLITAIWEAFCEDLAAEALDHIVTHTKSASSLPTDLLRMVASELKTSKNELAVWDLAGAGWQTVLKARLGTLAAKRNWNLNSPKTAQIDALFKDAIALPRVSESWRWKRMYRDTARAKLDKYVALRGEIAHRAKAASSVTKVQVDDYFSHVKQLVTLTDALVNSHVNTSCGKALWTAA